MSIPSRCFQSGLRQIQTVSVCGDGANDLVATGTTNTDAYQINKVYNNFITVASGSGVKLPSTEEGETITIVNNGANSLKIYPYETTSTISGSSSVVLPKGCSVICFAINSNSWHVLEGFNQSASTMRYGSFFDTTTQSAAIVNTAYGIKFNTTDLSNGVSRGSPTSRIIVSNAGIYNIQFSAQLDKASGATGHIYIWLRINGSNVSNSAGVVAIQGTSAESIAAWNYIMSLNANDYFEIMWSTNDTNVQLTYTSAIAPVPEIPSVILTVTQVNNI